MAATLRGNGHNGYNGNGHHNGSNGHDHKAYKVDGRNGGSRFSNGGEMGTDPMAIYVKALGGKRLQELTCHSPAHEMRAMEGRLCEGLPTSAIYQGIEGLRVVLGHEGSELVQILLGERAKPKNPQQFRKYASDVLATLPDGMVREFATYKLKEILGPARRVH